MDSPQQNKAVQKLNPLSKEFVPKVKAPEILEIIEQCQSPKPENQPKLYSDRQFRDLNERGDVAALVNYFYENTQQHPETVAAAAHLDPTASQDRLRTGNRRGRRAGIRRYQSHRGRGRQHRQIDETASYTIRYTFTKTEAENEDQQTHFSSPRSGDSGCSISYDNWDENWTDPGQESEGQCYAEKMERWMDWSDDEFVPGGL